MNIRNIAELAGCSPSTVSRVLAGKSSSILISAETKEKILAVCREHDYEPSIHASRFFSNKSGTIGFLTPAGEKLEDDNLARVMSTVYAELPGLGYRMLPLAMNSEFVSGQEYLRLFRRKEIDALMIWGVADNAVWIDELAARELPFILLTNRYKNHLSVSCDDVFGIKHMISHCQSRGAKSFVYVSVGSGDCCERRRQAFCDAVPNGSRQIISGGVSVEDGEKAAAQVISKRPDAVICGNDRLAIGLIKGLLAAGLKVPDDILVTGADNIELAEYCGVPLTTFDQMATSCARKALELLMKRLKSGRNPQSAIIKPQICIRDSA